MPSVLPLRLSAAYALLKEYPSCADIGCDHGYLTGALAKRENVRFLVAADVSEPSLEKAVTNLNRAGLAGKISFRAGNGFTVLEPGECVSAAVLGLGGEEMVRMFENAPDVVRKMERIVLQPMSGVEEIREYLYTHGFLVLSDEIVPEKRRLYQLFSVRFTGDAGAFPVEWPEAYWSAGYNAFSERDPLLPVLLAKQKQELSKRLKEAAGREGAERIMTRLEQIERVIGAYNAENQPES